MEFPVALAHVLNRRARIARKGWNGKGMYVYLHPGGDGVEPFLALHAADGREYPWVTSQADLLAHDWNFAD